MRHSQAVTRTCATIGESFRMPVAQILPITHAAPEEAQAPVRPIHQTDAVSRTPSQPEDILPRPNFAARISALRGAGTPRHAKPRHHTPADFIQKWLPKRSETTDTTNSPQGVIT
ncbi:hypothetical protein GGQ68_003356 [Sagittula marina]|uniref:Uncharacterized protein n=1 Tax=Sagittula marina TaxID=943940 RepID=A0A7W6DU97_9RHOB|nr:hypothetical protein [Sagittula marina]